MDPKASVIVVSYNSERWIHDCLLALERQEADFPFEIIVIDNGSTDATREIVSKQHPSTKLVTMANRGFGAGNNAGAALARGEWLAFVNPDTVTEPRWLQELVRPLSEPGVVTTSKIVLLDEPSRINTCGNLLHFTGYGFTNGFGKPASSFDRDQEVPGISGAAFAMRASDYRQVGGFDEDFFLYVEDTDLSWRTRRAGLRIRMISSSVVAHAYTFKLHASKIYFAEKGRVLLLRKHYRPLHWIAFLPSLLLSEIMAWAYAARLGRAGLAAKWKATREGWSAKISRSQLPAARLRDFALWRIPFDLFGSSFAIRLGAMGMNSLFWLNTLGWRGRLARPGA